MKALPAKRKAFPEYVKMPPSGHEEDPKGGHKLYGPMDPSTDDEVLELFYDEYVS